MTNQELKPCPNLLCGSTDIHAFCNTTSMCLVYCSDCGIEVDGFETIEKAIVAWNNRPYEQQIKADAVRYGYHKGFSDRENSDFVDPDCGADEAAAEYPEKISKGG